MNIGHLKDPLSTLARISPRRTEKCDFFGNELRRPPKYDLMTICRKNADNLTCRVCPTHRRSISKRILRIRHARSGFRHAVLLNGGPSRSPSASPWRRPTPTLPRAVGRLPCARGPTLAKPSAKPVPPGKYRPTKGFVAQVRCARKNSEPISATLAVAQKVAGHYSRLSGVSPRSAR